MENDSFLSWAISIIDLDLYTGVIAITIKQKVSKDITREVLKTDSLSIII